MRIETAALRGRPVSFSEIMPWTRPSRMPDTAGQQAHVSIGEILATGVIGLLFVSAAIIARHNVKKGRGDRRGALQLAVFVSM